MNQTHLHYAFALALILFSWALSGKELSSVMQMATKGKAQALVAQDDDFIQALMSSFQEVGARPLVQVGRNTGYIIHPEEILVENVVLALAGKLDVKDEWVVGKISGEVEGRVN